MQETTFSIDAFDGKKIFCIHNPADGAKADRAVVLSHGLTGGPYQFMHMSARDHFIACGYDTFRFAYYYNEPGHRLLDETTLAVHARDLETVLAHLRPDYKRLFVCGHSYGGLTCLFANPDVAALSLWDTAYHPGWVGASEQVGAQTHLLFGGRRNLVGAGMLAEAQRLLTHPEELETLAAALKAPAQIIVAGAGEKQKHLDDLYALLTCVKEKVVVPEADHNFCYKNTAQDLLRLTEDWFARQGGEA